MNRKAGALTWLPVLGIIALLFGMPASEGATALDATLTVPHENQYGGTLAHWTVDGLPANARAHLQRRGSTTSTWADVDDSFGIGTTNARGHLEFDFHTPAMNSVYIRVIAGGGVSQGVHFLSKQQDAELTLTEDKPAERALPKRGDGVAQAFAVNNESFTFRADTAFLADKKQAKPVLLGRATTLERRVITGNTVDWKPVASGTVGRDGFATFPGLVGGRVLPAGDYRVMLEHWTQAGDDIGEFPSFPFNVKVVDRPLPASVFSGTAASDTKVNLTWRLPTDINRSQVVLARSQFGPANLNSVLVTLPGTATTYADTSVYGPATFNYAIYTLSSDGMYTRTPLTTSVTTPAPPPKGGEH